MEASAVLRDKAYYVTAHANKIASVLTTGMHPEGDRSEIIIGPGLRVEHVPMHEAVFEVDLPILAGLGLCPRRTADTGGSIPRPRPQCGVPTHPHTVRIDLGSRDSYSRSE